MPCSKVAAEVLLGLLVDSEGVSFQVRSGGCTSTKSFTIHRAFGEEGKLQLVRTNPDYCKAYLPYGTVIRYSWRDLGFAKGSRFTVVNSIAPIFVNGE